LRVVQKKVPPREHQKIPPGSKRKRQQITTWRNKIPGGIDEMTEAQPEKKRTGSREKGGGGDNLFKLAESGCGVSGHT